MKLKGITNMNFKGNLKICFTANLKRSFKGNLQFTWKLSGGIAGRVAGESSRVGDTAAPVEIW